MEYIAVLRTNKGQKPLVIIEFRKGRFSLFGAQRAQSLCYVTFMGYNMTRYTIRMSLIDVNVNYLPKETL